MKNMTLLEKTWKEVLGDFLETKSYRGLIDFVANEYSTGTVYPPYKDIFKAFRLTPFDELKVVILGQDPYHDDGQAEGLCFSVKRGTKLPPSLKNIYKEIESDLSVHKDMTDGNLESWGKQGVLLLNAILTVRAHTPASHKGKGWEEFTDMVIRTVSERHEHIVFILWGKYAQSKKSLIDDHKHLILTAAHPSPFSAHNGFFGCKHFSKCNSYLKKHGGKGIVW